MERKGQKDVVENSRPAGVSDQHRTRWGAKKPVAEPVLIYGRGVTLRAHEGVPTHCSLFARIPGDWKYEWSKFALECRKARWEGPQVLRIERVN